MPHYLKDEKVQMKIMMADYRRKVPFYVIIASAVVGVIAGIIWIIFGGMAASACAVSAPVDCAVSSQCTPTPVVAGAELLPTPTPLPPTPTPMPPTPEEQARLQERWRLCTDYNSNQFLAAVFVLLALVTIAKSVDDLLQYYQWQFILTNKRIIIMAPDLRQKGFADVIYLKGGKIQVVDTNWSHSSYWGFFQAMTGARDVNLSMGGYEFKELGAEVKSGLRFPDVTPEDSKLLEEIIFG